MADRILKLRELNRETLSRQMLLGRKTRSSLSNVFRSLLRNSETSRL